jgi:uncharacterized repeat protein (TIGR03803 family)
MRTLACYVVSFGAIAALLAGCGGLQPPIGAPGVMRQTHALGARGKSTNYKVLYRFHGKPDASLPYASLIDVNGTLYGTTEMGGTANRGVIFSITKSGSEKVLYSVQRKPDGALPAAAVIDVNGTLYGTTLAGGSYHYTYYTNAGTVFSVTTSGAEKVLHSFGHRNDGVQPVASLFDGSHRLYGTTRIGGKYNCGTVFSITTSGSEKLRYSFAGGTDGCAPVAGLIDVGGTLYGTTSRGGAYSVCAGGGGCGTVFSVTTSGTERVLHSFGYRTDGGIPTGGLIDVDGTLYGTTSSGGASGDGTVFSITTSGSEKVVHSFAGDTDGSNPTAGLIDVGGTLYGTTANGGSAGFGTEYQSVRRGGESIAQLRQWLRWCVPFRGLDRRERHALRDHRWRRHAHRMLLRRLWNRLRVDPIASRWFESNIRSHLKNPDMEGRLSSRLI